MPKPKRSKTPRLTHFDKSGQASMVDVGSKHPTRRTATASAFVELSRTVLAALPSNPKGNPLEVARFAGIQAAKRTADLIPMCHPLAVHSRRRSGHHRPRRRVHHVFRVNNRSHRCRNGGSYRCGRCRAHRLRHDQGTRQEPLSFETFASNPNPAARVETFQEIRSKVRPEPSHRRRIATRIDFTLDLRRPGPACAEPCGSGEMANTPALGAGAQKACGFKSRLPHQFLCTSPAPAYDALLYSKG